MQVGGGDTRCQRRSPGARRPLTVRHFSGGFTERAAACIVPLSATNGKARTMFSVPQAS
jgi:hypothetical protein